MKNSKAIKTTVINLGLVILVFALAYLFGGVSFIQENKVYLVAFTTVMAFITVMPFVPKREQKNEK
ncbi:hypothetical protein [Streptococcus sp. DD12]|uniref:hypothetical protein n=1 Tax=Streptococcus sp. DD12 TaxID=1777880 RepID=UPI000795344D|nr:hypothetical protein [Streptococcus sp. DD12]KXT75208.1 hypothetical protein STRDD12_01558 [Streptococcus sp. DD12]